MEPGAAVAMVTGAANGLGRAIAARLRDDGFLVAGVDIEPVSPDRGIAAYYLVEHEAWVGHATLELRPNAQLPAHLLAVGEVVLGLHRTVDLTLPPGHVIHRYEAA